MKWVVLLALVCACGKNKQPPRVFQEPQIEAEVNEIKKDPVSPVSPPVVPEVKKSNIHPVELETISMNLKLAHGDWNVTFSNLFDPKKVARQLLVKKGQELPSDAYNSDWARLHRTEKKIPELPEQSSFQLDLSFMKSKYSPETLQLVGKTGTLKIWKWAPEMEITLRREELSAVLKSEYFFSMARKDISDLMAETYRVFLQDAQKTSIYYVSSKLSFDEFLKEMNIQQYTRIEDHHYLTTTMKDQTPQWWLRTAGRDQVLVRDDRKSLSDFYLSLNRRVSMPLGRVNGQTKGTLHLEKHPEARVILKVYGVRQGRSFSENSERVPYIIPGTSSIENMRVAHCDLHKRTVAEDKAQILGTEQIQKELIFIDQGYTKHLTDLKIRENPGQDSRGHFVEYVLNISRKSFKFTVESLPASSNVTIGVFKTDCPNTVRRQQSQTNSEAYLNLQVEAYVENL